MTAPSVNLMNDIFAVCFIKDCFRNIPKYTRKRTFLHYNIFKGHRTWTFHLSAGTSQGLLFIAQRNIFAEFIKLIYILHL